MSALDTAIMDFAIAVKNKIASIPQQGSPPIPTPTTGMTWVGTTAPTDPAYTLWIDPTHPKYLKVKNGSVWVHAKDYVDLRFSAQRVGVPAWSTIERTNWKWNGRTVYAFRSRIFNQPGSAPTTIGVPTNWATSVDKTRPVLINTQEHVMAVTTTFKVGTYQSNVLQWGSSVRVRSVNVYTQSVIQDPASTSGTVQEVMRHGHEMVSNENGADVTATGYFCLTGRP